MEEDKPKRIKRTQGQRYTAQEKRQIKDLYLAALVEKAGLKYAARRTVGSINWDTIELWKRQDPEFAEAEAKAIAQGTADFGDVAEAALVKQVQSGDTTAIIFVLKTRFRNRGYAEKQEITADVNARGFEIVVGDQRTADELAKIRED